MANGGVNRKRGGGGGPSNKAKHSTADLGLLALGFGNMQSSLSLFHEISISTNPVAWLSVAGTYETPLGSPELTWPPLGLF